MNDVMGRFYIKKGITIYHTPFSCDVLNYVDRKTKRLVTKELGNYIQVPVYREIRDGRFSHHK